MALIKCPKCARYMSAREHRCIYCGQSIPVHTPIIEGAKRLAPTPITPAEKHTVGIAILTVAGLLLSGLSVVVSSLAGILLLLGGGVMLSKAGNMSVGAYRVYCPNCGKPGKMRRSAQNYICPYCAQKSVKNSEYLHIPGE